MRIERKGARHAFAGRAVQHKIKSAEARDAKAFDRASDHRSEEVR